MTHRNTSRWIDVLPEIVQSYNNSFHRTIEMAPNEVNSNNEVEITRRMYGQINKPVWKFNVGDTVRITKY